jgi:hypothetical protein
MSTIIEGNEAARRPGGVLRALLVLHAYLDVGSDEVVLYVVVTCAEQVA